MKRIILIIASILFLVTGAQAQMANRRGFFIELQGGSAFGEVLTRNYNYNYSPYLKGGAVGGIDFGYRFRTSNSFAFELKLGYWTDFSEVKYTTSMNFQPGIRWTSKEFGSSNISMFIALNAGMGAVFGEELAATFPIELGVGANFTNHFYGGLAISARGMLGHAVLSDYWQGHVNDIQTHSYGAVGLRLGYRF